jgi:hypothetical protein
MLLIEVPVNLAVGAAMDLDVIALHLPVKAAMLAPSRVAAVELTVLLAVLAVNLAMLVAAAMAGLGMLRRGAAVMVDPNRALVAPLVALAQAPVALGHNVAATCTGVMVGLDPLTLHMHRRLCSGTLERARLTLLHPLHPPLCPSLVALGLALITRAELLVRFLCGCRRGEAGPSHRRSRQQNSNQCLTHRLLLKIRAAYVPPVPPDVLDSR